MVNQGQIKPYRKKEFDILFYSLLNININRRMNDNKSFERLELVDLSSKNSDEGYRYIFSESFQRDYSIRHICFKLRDLLEEKCVFETPEVAVKNIDEYLKIWNRDYHEYWQLLYPIHVKCLLLFTLGFNIENFQFFEDAKLELWKLKEENKKIFIYRMDIDRHHLDLDAEYYLPLDFSEIRGYIPKLAPLVHSDHTKLINQIKSGRWDNVKYITQLYKSRLVHLFELILSFNKYESLGEELRDRMDVINNNIVYIWQGISDNTLIAIKY